MTVLEKMKTMNADDMVEFLRNFFYCAFCPQCKKCMVKEYESCHYALKE